MATKTISTAELKNAFDTIVQYQRQDFGVEQTEVVTIPYKDSDDIKSRIGRGYILAYDSGAFNEEGAHIFASCTDNFQKEIILSLLLRMEPDSVKEVVTTFYNLIRSLACTCGDPHCGQ